MDCYVVRHAQTILNRRQILQGWADPPLSEEGITQARRLYGKMPPWPIYVSDLTRALRTAECLAWPGQRIQPDARLREIDVGAWQGVPKQHLRQKALWQEYEVSPASFRFPGGESLQELQTRVLGAFHEYEERHGRVIVVSHHLALKSLLCYLRGWSLDRIHQFALPNAVAVHISWTSGSPGVQIEQLDTDP